MSEEKKMENHECKSSESQVTKQIRNNPWILSTIVLGILTIILMAGTFNGMTISEEDVGQNLLVYYEAQGISGLELLSVEDTNGLYKVDIKYQGETIPFYVTKSGYLTGNSIIPLLASEEEKTEVVSETIPKQDVPEVELFVMTHCPYGTQAEKGVLAAFDALEGTIDSSIKFVHYFLHDPEYTETPVQICIREEQNDKFDNYLACFLEDGDTTRCLSETGIDQTQLSSCVENNYESYYAADSALSEGYGVRGSPTLVVNGKIVASGRDSASYLDTICQSFNNAPEACSLELPSETPAPGFGWDGTSSATAASC